MITLLIVVSVFLLRDTHRRPLSEKEFVDLYVEVVKLQTRLADRPLEARKKTRALLDQAGVNEEGMNRFAERINKDPEHWVEIWDKITKELAADTTLPRNR